MPDTRCRGAPERGPCGRHRLYEVHCHLAQVSLLWGTNRADSEGMGWAPLPGSREWLLSTLLQRRQVTPCVAAESGGWAGGMGRPIPPPADLAPNQRAPWGRGVWAYTCRHREPVACPLVCPCTVAFPFVSESRRASSPARTLLPPGSTLRPPWTSSGPASTYRASGRGGTSAPRRQVPVLPACGVAVRGHVGAPVPPRG